MRSLPFLVAASVLVAQHQFGTTADAYRSSERNMRADTTLAAYIIYGGSIEPRKAARNVPLFARRPHKLKLTAAGQFRIKPKTNKSVAKRFKITGTGKIMYKRAGRSHLQRKKNQGAKRRLRRAVQLTNPKMIRKILSVLHNR
ncbi:ribosomal protein L35, putative [Babesia bigemina]|uniref:50S ribosomal protein L35 n=1 Tax=Babesia bigemina TaxID=5866 RepID=A0A061D595_BABBI|nr:ribosomal protein L35, putative [Babesia bigemina]CDR95733.1 ribosomal protein L35, putative [Babesia bigemina]|eukprot:XP_012767919.1 ribosomal protein L35, putative [Babesia bigemina]